MNKSWNALIYKAWSPVYDKVFDSGPFLTARKTLFDNNSQHYWQTGQDILFVGVGTGADLAHIDHETVNITAIDYSEAMLNQARQKFAHTDIQFLPMDAQQLSFKDNRFDVVVASLILSVVPDADACFAQMLRVLKPDGRIIIFDKFLPKNGKLSVLKRAVRPVIGLLGTDIGVSFEAIQQKHQDHTVVIEDKPLLFGGMYRKIIVRKIPMAESG